MSGVCRTTGAIESLRVWVNSVRVSITTRAHVDTARGGAASDDWRFVMRYGRILGTLYTYTIRIFAE